MIYGLYQSAAGMMVNEYRQDVIANNLANAETVGFKRDLASFRERANAQDVGERSGPTHEMLDRLTGGIWLGETVTDYAEGNMIRTGGRGDIAIAGPGFFVVRGADDEEMLTRDGRFMPDNQGMLRSVTDGAPVVGVGGTTIRINPRGGEMYIDQNGFVTQDGVRRGQLLVRDVDDYSKLTKLGNARFAANDAGTSRILFPQLRQEFLEDSGVQPVTEMTNMLEASRAYQFNAQLITLQDQSLGRLLSSLTNV